MGGHRILTVYRVQSKEVGTRAIVGYSCQLSQYIVSLGIPQQVLVCSLFTVFSFSLFICRSHIFFVHCLLPLWEAHISRYVEIPSYTKALYYCTACYGVF